MCLLIVCEPGAVPTRESLTNACSNNPDGAGFAFAIDDAIVTERHLTAERSIRHFLAIREANPDAWCMFHARWATHGGISAANVHPFAVDGDPNIVLAHNGIFSLTQEDDDPRSDTRYFAEEWLPTVGIGLLDTRAGIELLEGWADSNMFAILSTSARLEHTCYIVNEALGEWKDGVWYSNTSHTYKASQWRWGWSSDDYEWSTFAKADAVDPAEVRAELERGDDPVIPWCGWCGAILSTEDQADNICGSCDTCLICGERWMLCNCSTTAWRNREYATANAANTAVLALYDGKGEGGD